MKCKFDLSQAVFKNHEVMAGPGSTVAVEPTASSLATGTASLVENSQGKATDISLHSCSPSLSCKKAKGMVKKKKNHKTFFFPPNLLFNQTTSLVPRINPHPASQSFMGAISPFPFCPHTGAGRPVTVAHSSLPPSHLRGSLPLPGWWHLPLHSHNLRACTRRGRQGRLCLPGIIEYV